MKRNREKTHTRIRLAIVPIEKGRPKIISSTRRISIAAVAEEAEVSTTLIHNQYPDLKARIQGNQNKEVQSQRNDIRLKYQIEKQKNREYRAQIKELTQTNKVLASKLARCLIELEFLSAASENQNVTTFKRR
jgi:AcrR family transcriptional regulator